jgi:hypothetical protein
MQDYIFACLAPDRAASLNMNVGGLSKLYQPLKVERSAVVSGTDMAGAIQAAGVREG